MGARQSTRNSAEAGGVSSGVRRLLARGLALAFLASLAFGAYATVHQYQFTMLDDGGAYFDWQNAGRALAFVSLALLLGLNRIQCGVFGWTPRSGVTGDERQERTAVFARSFQVALVCVVIAAVLVYGNEAWIAERISQPTNVYPNPYDMHWLLFDFALLIGALPNLIGAWRPSGPRPELGSSN